MNFPMDRPIFQFFYFLLNTPGLGGIAVSLVAATCLTSYGLILRWIRKGAQADEAEEYAYPTPALHSHH